MGLFFDLLGMFLGVDSADNSNNAKKKNALKTKKDFDCPYDCKDCSHSWECADDGDYLEDEDDYEKY